MAPGQPALEEPPAKRQRRALNDDKFEELKAAQHAYRTGDALAAPAVRTALDSIIERQRSSDAQRKQLESVLKIVKESLDALPTKKTVQVDSAITRNTIRRTAPGVHISSLVHGEDTEELSYVCKAPQRINVVGSFLLGYSSGGVADVAVEMPPGMIQSKDYLNYRYHNKRLLYLVYLARHFAKTEEDKWSKVSLTDECLNGDKDKPVLCLSHVDHPGVIVRLIPTYADGVFEKFRLGDDRKNVRTAGTSSIIENPDEATASYNASIWIDCTLVDNLQVLHSASSAAPAFGEAVLLLKAWCTRNRLMPSKFVLAALLTEVIQKGGAPQRAPREHLLRSALIAIQGSLLQRLQLGGLKLCASYDPALLTRCEEAATAALCSLENKTATDDPWFGVLPFLFTTARGGKITPRPLSTLFDGFLRVSGDELTMKLQTKQLQRLLSRTLIETGRVQRIEHLGDGLFGLHFLSEAAIFRKVDTRPDTVDSQSYKAFWGERAGLRRFKDGRIVESLVWSGGRHTLSEMCSYAFEKHMNSRLVPHVIIGAVEEAAGVSDFDESTGKAIGAFDQLASMLRSLDGLPLKIRAVHATAAHLRRCGAYPTRPFNESRYVEPLDIVASFESSGAWPDDPIAITSAKAAFYVALRSALAESGVRSKATISFLEAELGGFVFRVRIRVDKEKKALLESPENLATLLWETEQRVEHHERIKEVGNVMMMGNVARLLKRWLNKHMLLAQMGNRAEEMVETIVASVVDRSELSARKSADAYFSQVLHLLAEFPWEVCPLAVWLRGETDEDARDEDDGEHARFIECAQKRHTDKADGHLAFAVYNAWSKGGEDVETWFGSMHSPEKVIAQRVVATAVGSLKFIESQLKSDAPQSLCTVFQTPTDAYDVVLELDETQVPAGRRAEKSPFRKKGRSFLAGIDPVWRLRNELEEGLGKFALFLCEKLGRARIFVVWRPAALTKVKFSLRDAALMEPLEDGMMQPALGEIVAEMRRIGQGLVTGVGYPTRHADEMAVDSGDESS